MIVIYPTIPYGDLSVKPIWHGAVIKYVISQIGLYRFHSHFFFFFNLKLNDRSAKLQIIKIIFIIMNNSPKRKWNWLPLFKFVFNSYYLCLRRVFEGVHNRFPFSPHLWHIYWHVSSTNTLIWLVVLIWMGEGNVFIQYWWLWKDG